MSEETLKICDEKIEDFVMKMIPCVDENSKCCKITPEIVLLPKEIESVVLRYFALANNNIKLLEKLIAKKFDFSIKHYSFKLYALDRMLSSKFDEDKFINLLFSQDEVIRKFYISIRRLSLEEKEKIISDFSYILQNYPKIAFDNKDDKAVPMLHLLSYSNLKHFSRDFIIKSTIYQRRVLNSLDSSLDEHDYTLVNALLKKYPKIEPKIPLNSIVLRLFTFEEINNMSDKDSILYLAAMNIDFLDKMKEILNCDPDFDCSLDFIKPIIFTFLDTKTIVGLTDEAKQEISEIEIDHEEGIYIIPERKIKKIITKDERRKKSDEKKKRYHM